MPKPSQVTKVVISGKAPNGDIWNTGWWISHSTAFDSQAALQTFADAGGPALHTAVNSLAGSLMTDGTTADRATLYYHADSGDLPTTYIAVYELAIAASGTQSLPNQCSVVATLLTGVPGRRSRGRMYWPCWKPTISDGTGELTDTVINAVAAQTAAALEAWNDTADAAVVCSSAASHSWAINEVAVDSRVDIQRRRANRESVRARVTHAVSPT